jgi:hypothetical protein
MSANNYIKIEETSADKFRVAEKDYETDSDICHLGDFDLLKTAIKEAEDYMADIENEVEYGIRFSLIDNKADSKDFDAQNIKKENAENERD